MIRKVDVSDVFDKNNASLAKIVVNEGGSRSGKTYSILQLLIFVKALNVWEQVFTIVRKTMPSLRGTVMRDFFEILKEHGMYDEKHHNKTENTYQLRRNLFEFVSLDQPQKKRGAKRHYLFINEANELSLEDWIQLSIRTENQIFLDYNPSIPPDHWINEVVKPRPDCEVIHSTYKDNLAYLAPAIIQEIENLKNVDPAYWQIYGLGLPAEISGVIFTNWKEVEEFPVHQELKWLSYGMDFGFEHDPTTLIKVGMKDGEIYVEEMIYSTGLLGSDLAVMMSDLGLNWGDDIVADRKPEMIFELRRAGFNLKAAYKPPGSVDVGIDVLKRYRINIVKSSLNIIKEFRNYKWREDRNGNKLREPVDKFNHAIDALRYVVTSRELYVRRKLRLGKVNL
jgi:phage terminase large subunit